MEPLAASDLGLFGNDSVTLTGGGGGLFVAPFPTMARGNRAVNPVITVSTDNERLTHHGMRLWPVLASDNPRSERDN